MEQQDYLKKQTEQLGRVLGKVISELLGLKNQGQINDAVEITNQAIKGELDFDIQELTDIPSDKLIDILTRQKNVTNDNLEKLAEILLIIADNRPEDNKNLYEKCLTIYEHLERAESTYSLGRQWKIQRIKNVL